ncbi:hypothetical protein PG911_08685 [Tenacibaculum ovolyticum]|uniref:hypothetical protein n=1 Tax=Tenacibaculum ovolyticum TaxID=104270 RepID=UPI0022F40038|nr:hypothetical protein [Tenacibaculum ovolyticum]WBX78321.1 hypothetical protein PG911_08685 [Tenacibaculum ovolyticum]
MKKVLIILGMFSVIILTSCTDNTEENLVEKEKLQLIDKDKSKNPVGGGQGGNDDNEEG